MEMGERVCVKDINGNIIETEVRDEREERIKELEKENKNLKLIQETNEKQIQNDIKERDELRVENDMLRKMLRGDCK